MIFPKNKNFFFSHFSLVNIYVSYRAFPSSIKSKFTHRIYAYDTKQKKEFFLLYFKQTYSNTMKTSDLIIDELS